MSFSGFSKIILCVLNKSIYTDSTLYFALLSWNFPNCHVHMQFVWFCFAVLLLWTPSILYKQLKNQLALFFGVFDLLSILLLFLHMQTFNQGLIGVHIHRAQSRLEQRAPDPQIHTEVLVWAVCCSCFFTHLGKKSKYPKTQTRDWGIFGLVLYKHSCSCQNSISLFFISWVHLNTKELLHELFWLFPLCTEFLLILIGWCQKKKPTRLWCIVLVTSCTCAHAIRLIGVYIKHAVKNVRADVPSHTLGKSCL